MKTARNENIPEKKEIKHTIIRLTKSKMISRKDIIHLICESVIPVSANA